MRRLAGLLGLLWLSVACQPAAPVCSSSLAPRPQDPTPRCIHQLWDAQGKGHVRLSPRLKQLPDDAFPLQLSAAPMKADSFLPSATSPTQSIARKELDGTRSFGLFGKEYGVVLRDAQGQRLDWTTVVAQPKDAVLVRTHEKELFCQQKAWFEQQKCSEIPRQKLLRVRHIRSQAEYAQLTQNYGNTGLQTKVIKFVIDMERDDLPHFYDTKTWRLHFSYTYEVIDQKPRLDTCKADQYKLWWEAYQAFVQRNMTRQEGRRYLMGTLAYYPGAKLYTIEFQTGYNTTGANMLRGYRRIREAIDPRIDIRLRPFSEEQKAQIDAAQSEPALPLWPSDAPYQGETTQLLSPGVAYGTLKLLRPSQLPTAALGPQVIALLPDVPNDIRFVGGIISTRFQSPLSHINVLSRNRGTPHLVLHEALQDPKIQKLQGKLVRLEVHQERYVLQEARRADAEAFWQAQRGKRVPFEPQRDLSQRGLVDLKDAAAKALPQIGAKAANLAEMARISLGKYATKRECVAFARSRDAIELPKKPFAIPFYWYAEHMQRAGLQDRVLKLHQDAAFRADAAHRRKELQKLRQSIEQAPVSPDLLELLHGEIRSRYGEKTKIRFRSSTNVEDLADFNGAGLYVSKSGTLEHATKAPSHALRKVWASLWSERAWDEREYYRVDHLKAAMGVLVHPSFPDPNEAANGVAVSSNIFYAGSSPFDTYIAVQKGASSIVLPQDHETPDQLLLRWSVPPQILFISRSSLTGGAPVLSKEQTHLLGCYMRAIHHHFEPKDRGNKPYAMEAEFKLLREPSILVLKQTRPYIYGESPPAPPRSCD